ncbi:hypothetical protein XsacCFBP4641_13245 [Xanthomonas sacchari]|uniref:Uncharacterized protein n=1 Tax=Xanthomonas sacchari TaxID=56458 RepID=A0A2P5Z2R3_9XANT|nr:hypothetical protein XsacCFBP4641_13245 [Xanthomonas sacchari]
MTDPTKGRRESLPHRARTSITASPLGVAVAWLWLLPLLLTYRVPFRSGGHHGETPAGRRTWMCAVRGRGRMPLPRIPGMDADPERVSAEGARQGALSFGYFSLREQRKVTRRKAKALLLHLLSPWLNCAASAAAAPYRKRPVAADAPTEKHEDGACNALSA